MSLRRTLTAADRPPETRFFLFLAAFGIGIGIVYWFVAYESAGTVLLVGFGVANGLIGLRLAVTGSDTASSDRPFADDTGRLPDETIAPFAIGLGVALGATGLIFGPAPLVVGLLPLAWGAWAWLSGARAELDAQVADDAAVVDAPLTRTGRQVGTPRP